MRRILLLAALALGGCSYFYPEPTTYAKPGTSQDQVSADVDSCRQQARAVAKRDATIDQDIANRAGRYNNLGGDDDPRFTANLQQYGDQARYHEMVSDCMDNLGYGPGETSGY